MVDALLAANDGLASFPHRWRPMRGTPMRGLVTVSPYTNRYRIAGDAVIILRAPPQSSPLDKTLTQRPR
jgi:plasmid stabilization system protein ParE